MIHLSNEMTAVEGSIKKECQSLINSQREELLKSLLSSQVSMNLEREKGLTQAKER